MYSKFRFLITPLVHTQLATSGSDTDKNKFTIVTNHPAIKAYRGVWVKLHKFLTSVFDRGEHRFSRTVSSCLLHDAVSTDTI
jgi:hypothetical protein